MAVEVAQVSALAGRSADSLTRRDVALALLGTSARDALDSLPALRRQLTAAGNPLSAPFWSSAETVLTEIDAGRATEGRVYQWLEATGTHPTVMIGPFVWPEPEERGEQANELYGHLVGYLEERVRAGEIDADALASGDAGARQACVELQQRWLTTPLPDGRVPMEAVEDEVDEEFLAGWDAADAEALGILRRVLDEVGPRPRPDAELHAACARLRGRLAISAGTDEVLAAGSGLDPEALPADDAELWLALATGVVDPKESSLHEGGPDGDLDESDLDELGLVDQTQVTLMTIEHVDWLGAVTALARGGPGTAARGADLAAAVAESEDVDGDFDDPDEERALAAQLDLVEILWERLGALDELRRLTPLGWWGLPEALARAWSRPEAPG